jgi:dCTP deaminase
MEKVINYYIIMAFGGCVIMKGVLADRDIIKYIMQKKLAIDPFTTDNLTPNGYDLTIAEILIPRDGVQVDQDEIEIPSLTWFAVSTLEYVKIGPDLTAEMWIRTSHARRGIIGSFGKIDSGFEGNLTLSSFNGSHEPVILKIGDTFAQMVFEFLTSEPEALYSERSGTYQGQRGVTLQK